MPLSVTLQPDKNNATSYIKIRARFCPHLKRDTKYLSEGNTNNKLCGLSRERTISTVWPPLVGEVNANFCGLMVPRGKRDGSPRPYSRISRQDHLLPLIIKMLPNNNQVCALLTLFTTVTSN
jgi:hypothetical protein